MAALTLDNAEIVRACLQVMGLGRDATNMDEATEADVRAVIRAGLRRFYFPLVGDYTYQWRFLEKRASFPSEAVFDDGTIAVSGGTITLTGSTWPSWMLDGFIRVDGHVLFIATTPTTTTATTPNTGLTIAGGTAFEAYRYRYELPSDFSEWLGGVVYANGSRNRLLANADESELRLRYAIGQGLNAETTHYAVTASPDADGQYIMFWPVPAPDAFAQGTYLSTPADSLPADLTAPGSTIQVGPMYAQAVMEAILAEAESFYNNSGNLHEAKFQAALKVAISHDKSVGGHYDFNHQINKGYPGSEQVLPIDFSTQL